MMHNLPGVWSQKSRLSKEPAAVISSQVALTGETAPVTAAGGHRS